MTVYEAILFGASMVGAFNAALLTLLWLAPDRRGVLPDFWPYPALAAISGVIVLLIAAEHAGLAGGLDGLEWWLTALSGPLLIDAVRRSSGRASAWPVFLAAPVIVFAALSLSRITGWPVIVFIVAGQAVCTLAAVWTRWRPLHPAPALRAASVLIAVFIAVHLAQAARMAAPALMRDLVAWALIFAFAALTTILLLRSRALGGWFRSVDRSRTADAEAAILALRRWLREGAAWREPDLRLSDAAAAVNVPAGDLSRWLNERGEGFAGLLTDIRLDRAAALLQDPAEARTSVEAVGLMSGFASRSGFYKAFTKRFGVTPAAYRRAGAD